MQTEEFMSTSKFPWSKYFQICRQSAFLPIQFANCWRFSTWGLKVLFAPSISQPQDFLSLIFIFSLCPKHGSGVGATPQVDVCSCQKKFLVTKSAINYRAEHCLKISFLVKNLNLFCHLKLCTVEQKLYFLAPDTSLKRSSKLGSWNI